MNFFTVSLREAPKHNVNASVQTVSCSASEQASDCSRRAGGRGAEGGVQGLGGVSVSAGLEVLEDGEVGEGGTLLRSGGGGHGGVVGICRE